MVKISKKFFQYALFIFLIGGFFHVIASTTNGTIDVNNHTALLCMDDTCVTTTRINFLPTKGTAVHVTNSGLTGDIWSEEAGWINLNPTRAGVRNTDQGILSGYAWGENTGWINFSPSNGGVVINSIGQFVGWAWAQNFGWIKFDCSVNDACVKTDWRHVNSSGGPTTTDICPNISGIQEVIPTGMVIDSKGNCITPEQCNIIDGALKQPLDVMILIDKSGSMAGTKLTQAKTAATAFINNLVLGSDRVGYISYSTVATLESGLTTSFDTVKSDIADTVSGGNTNIGGAMKVAYQEMLSNGRSGVKHVIVILTDGQANISDTNTLTPNQYAINQADLTKINGMIVYTVGLGTGVDTTLLQSMATLPSYFYNSPTGNDLSNIYLQIAALECTAAPSKVYDSVIFDANNNGILDPGEVGLAGSLVSLISSDGSQPTRTIPTLADGSFLFDSVASGVYQVCNTPPTGMHQTKPTANGCYNINVTQGFNVNSTQFLVAGDLPFCSLHADDPSCNPTPPFCTTFPADPSCNPSFCSLHPADPSCGGNSSTDYCPNIAGVQGVVPDGYTINPSGDCVPISNPSFCSLHPTDPTCVTINTDYCPNISGIQDIVPDGYIINSDGDCVKSQTFCELHPDNQQCICEQNPDDPSCTNVDICPNLPGIQTTILDGYVINSSGDCVPSQTFCDQYPNDPSCGKTICEIDPTDPSCVNNGVDHCPNIIGIQDTIPDGYIINTNGNCVPATTFCEQNPTDAKCTNSSYCSLYPLSSSCISSVPFCTSHPKDPSCQSPSFCTLNPTSVLCTTKNEVSKVFENINGNVVIALENPVGNATSKIIETTGVATGMYFGVVSLAFAGQVALMDLLLLPLRLWNLLLAFLGLRKKRQPWGTVYDSVTKQPLDPAYVVLQDLNGKEITTSITDLEGRYGFLVPAGQYRIVANKTHYEFPSKRLAGKHSDELYNDLYFNEIIEVKNDGEVITRNIPMDPTGFDWNEFAKRDRNLIHFNRKRSIWINRLSEFFFFFGFLIAIVSTIVSPIVYNIIILGVYVLLLIMRETILKPRTYGFIEEKENKSPLPFAVVRIFFEGTSHEVSRKIADAEGKYYCLIPNGRYYTKIERKNTDETYSVAHISDPIDVKRGYINKKFEIEGE